MSSLLHFSLKPKLLWLKLFAVQSKLDIIATVQTDIYYEAKWRPFHYISGPFHVRYWTTPPSKLLDLG